MIIKDYEIKSKLKEYRKLAGLTQQELAYRCGCSDTMIQLIEYNKCYPNLELAVKIVDVLSDELGFFVDFFDIFVF